MIAATLALRNRALGTTFATTGATSLSATSTGYARSAGSFITDGFAVGMEVLVAGFSTAANNGYGVITFVSATAMSVTKYALGATADGTQTIVSATATSAESAASGRSIIAGVPVLRAYENVKIAPNPIAPYVEEDFVPGVSSLIAGPYAGGGFRDDGLYVFKLYGLSGKGVSAIRKGTDAIRARFAPGTNLTAGSYTLKVRGDVAVRATQMLPLDSGWTVSAVEVPWFAHSTNAVVA
jgi:hypothetical protein